MMISEILARKLQLQLQLQLQMSLEEDVDNKGR